MITPESKKEESSVFSVFNEGGSLHSLGQKVNLAFSLGLIDRETHRDLKYILKIRNRCAHEVSRY